MSLTNPSSIQLTDIHHEKFEAELRLLNIRDIDQITKLEQTVIDSLPDKSSYFPEPSGVFEDSLNGNGIVLGCFIGLELIAFRSIWFPKDSPYNLGLDINLVSRKDLQSVAHLERTCVHPRFRGNRLQIKMTGLAIQLAVDKNYTIFLCTIAPGNYASMTDKFDAGMVICRLLKKYGGLDRYLFYKNMERPISDQDLTNGLRTSIDSLDIQRQYQILAQPGTHGVSLTRRDAAVDVNFVTVSYTNREKNLLGLNPVQ
jgi:hypothetical protein